jgi:hypothetical protein
MRRENRCAVSSYGDRSVLALRDVLLGLGNSKSGDDDSRPGKDIINVALAVY